MVRLFQLASRGLVVVTMVGVLVLGSGVASAQSHVASAQSHVASAQSNMMRDDSAPAATGRWYFYVKFHTGTSIYTALFTDRHGKLGGTVSPFQGRCSTSNGTISGTQSGSQATFTFALAGPCAGQRIALKGTLVTPTGQGSFKSTFDGNGTWTATVPPL